MNVFFLIMASSTSNPKASQNNPKRPRQNDSDTRMNIVNRLKKKEKQMSNISPFVIEKVLHGMVGVPKSI